MTTAIRNVRSILWDVFYNYSLQKQQPFAKNTWREHFQRSVPLVFEPLWFCKPLISHASAGQGNWAEVPWIGFRHPSLTESFQDGVYVVYLYPTDLSGVYLSLNQGVTAVKEASGVRAAHAILRQRAEQLRATLDIKAVLQDQNIDHINLNAYGDNGSLYESGHICGLYYPSTKKITTALERDLEVMLALYGRVVNMLAPATAGASSSIHRSSLERETDQFLETAALDLTTDVQSGTETRPTLVQRRKRQQALRRALLRVYAPECAACGLSFSVGNAHMLHAAHIIDVEQHGATVVRNGLLLCLHHHWSFDKGCWGITDDYRVEVHPSFMDHEFLLTIDGRAVAAPKDGRFRVDPKAIEVRRRNWASLRSNGIAPATVDDLALLEELP